jgi:hypothetical protein
MCCLKFGELLISKPYNIWPMRRAFFWDFTQRRLIVRSRRFGTTYWAPYSRVQQSFFLGCLTLEDGTDRFVETSVTNCRSTLRNIPEERRSHWHRGGSLKSRGCWRQLYRLCAVHEPCTECTVQLRYLYLTVMCALHSPYAIHTTLLCVSSYYV